MKRPEERLSAFTKPWKEFSRAWTNAHAEVSSKCIHDLRVTTRRLIARLELVGAVSNNEEIVRVQKDLKKLLKRMGALRDLQVELENLARLRANGVVSDFKQNLERRKTREVKTVRMDLKSGKRRRIQESIKALRPDFETLHSGPDNIEVRRSIERLIRTRRSEFFKARRRFKPGNEETLHKMRIALKKFRYVVEAAQPVLGGWAAESARKMHDFQQLMGNSRDVEILRAYLERWAVKRGKEVAVVPVLERLTKMRARMIIRITQASDMIEHIPQIEHVRLAKEVTRVAPTRPRLKPAPEVDSIQAVNETS
jgi:CHAD domain-containing protein